MKNYQKIKIPSLVPKNYKANLINDKISVILPELLDRNMKLTDRLKSKLKVSTFLNNTEIRNQKYLKIFLSSSEKRVKDIKTGLKLSKAVKQSHKNLSNLCSKIDNDAILQNSDFLNNEKKLLNENTEQETHMKIINLITNMRNILKKNKAKKKVENENNLKYMSKSYINNINNILKNKLENEKNIVNNKINSYKNKLKNSIKEKKEYKKYADNIDVANLKLLNYSKPKPIPITDRECPSMARIKNNLYPYMIQSNRNFRKKFINLNRKNNSPNSSFNEYGKSQILDKGSFSTLKGLASNGQNLTLKIDKTINKVNSLLDINLPNPKTYNILLEKNREEQLRQKSLDLEEKKQIYDEAEFEEIINNEKILDKQLINKKKMKKIINTFKNEIDKIKKILPSFDKKNKNDNNDEENIKNKYIIPKQLYTHFERIKTKGKQKNNNENNNSNYNEQSTSEFTRRLKSLNQNIIKKKEEESSLLNNSSNNYETIIIKEYKNNLI